MTRTMGEGADGSGHDAVCLRSIRTVVDIFGGKWGLLVVEQLHSGTMRFNEIARVLGIGTKSLTDTLRHLEECGIVSRTVKATVPVTVEYSLTDKGRDFDGVLLAMKDWCERWPAEAEGAVTVRDAAETDMSAILGIIAEAKEDLRSRGIPMWRFEYPSEDDVRGDISIGGGRVAVGPTGVVGYMRISFGPEGYQSALEGTWTGSSPSTMHRIAVARAAREHHVASRMMAAWEEEARSRGCDSLRAETVDENTASKALMESVGMHPVGYLDCRGAHAKAYEKMLRGEMVEPLEGFEPPAC